MRTLVVALFVALFTTAVFAQQPKNGFSIFVSDLEVTHGKYDGTHGSAAFGASFDRMLTPNVSAQLAIASEQHRSYGYVVNANGTFTQVPAVSFHTVPIDLAARYHFLNETRWKPYVGLGLRYVGAPGVGREWRYQNHIGPEIVGGTLFRINRSLFLTLDGRVYVGDREAYDSQFKPSLGLRWQF
jgi:outer membrane protein W